MPLFSQRKGITPLKKALQIDSLDNETRTKLWNGLCYAFFNSDRSSGGNYTYKQAELIYSLWVEFFKQRTDHYTANRQWWKEFLEEKVWNWDYDYLFDFIEYIVKNTKDDTEYVRKFTDYCNRIFEQESVMYRFVGNEITSITSDEEIKEIEIALNSPLDPVNLHLKTALEMLFDRKSPDYRNSIKESISAVECISQVIVGDKTATLGQALKKLEDNGISIAPALTKGFSNLYGWTNAEDGIRHAIMGLPKIKEDDARYMLITCSSFCNYLISKSNEAKINLKSNYEKLKK
jgi:hypothetical protein